jgi:hypothetical protein
MVMLGDGADVSGWPSACGFGAAWGWGDWTGRGACRVTVTVPPPVTGLVGVAHEKVAEFLRVAERGAMAAGDLVGDGAQALLCQPPHKGGGEELVVPAEDELLGPVRPPSRGQGVFQTADDSPRPPLRRASSASGRGTPL